MDETFFRALGALRLPAQSLNLDETLTRFLTLPRALTQSLNLDETFARFVIFQRTLTNPLNLDEILVRTLRTLRISVQTLDVGDVLSKFFSTARALRQTLTVNLDTARTFTGFRVVSQALDVGDTFSRVVFLIQRSSQAFTLNGFLERTALFARISSQASNINLATAKFITLSRTISEEFTFQTVTGRMLGAFRNLFQDFRLNFFVKRLRYFLVPDLEEGGAPGSGGVGGGGGGGGGGTPKKLSGSFYLSDEEINIVLKPKESRRVSFVITNNGTEKLNFIIRTGVLKEHILVLDKAFSLDPGQFVEIEALVTSLDQPGIYTTKFIIEADGIIQELPLIINVESEKKLFDINLAISQRFKAVSAGDDIAATVTIFNLGSPGRVDAKIVYLLKDLENNVILESSELVAIETRASFLKNIHVPEYLKPGKYVLSAEVHYDGTVGISSDTFTIVKRSDARNIFLILAIILCIILFIALLTWFFIHHYREKARVHIGNTEREIRDLLKKGREALAKDDTEKAYSFYRRMNNKSRNVKSRKLHRQIMNFYTSILKKEEF